MILEGGGGGDLLYSVLCNKSFCNQHLPEEKIIIIGGEGGQQHSIESWKNQ